MDIGTRRRYLRLTKHNVSEMAKMPYREYKLLEEGKLSIEHFSQEQKEKLEDALKVTRGSLNWGLLTQEPEVRVTHMDPKELDRMLREKYGDKLPEVKCPLNKREEARRTVKCLGENWHGKGKLLHYKRGRKKEDGTMPDMPSVHNGCG